jgi:hypothetical protein
VGEAEATFACDLHARTERETLFALAAIARGNSGSRASAMRSLRVTPEIGLIVDRYR